MSALQEAQAFERSAPYLTPFQVDELKTERDTLEDALRGPYAGRLENPREMRNRVRAIDRQIAEESPKPYAGPELDKAVKLEAELREEFVNGMPTQEEMRKNPAGAVERHRLWEHTHKHRIMLWKNLRKRLHASGALGKLRDDREVSNIEHYRPVTSPQSVPIHNAQIPGKSIHIPDTLAIRNVMSDEDRAAMLAKDEALRAIIAEEVEKRLAEGRAATVELPPVNASEAPAKQPAAAGGKR